MGWCASGWAFIAVWRRPVAGDYVALAVHQAARVVAAGHGGQVIASAPVVTAAADLSDVSFVRLGRFRLRDFDEPQPLFQLTAPGLPDTFAAPRAVPSDGHNIVRPASSFVGRERDLVEVASALSPRRLVTLLGPGGVGKSRLAAEVGVLVADQWDGGVWIVEVDAIGEPALLPGAVARTLGLSLTSVDPWDDVFERLRTERTLIVLDGCEHLVDACAAAVERMLRAAPEVGVLATSREPLRVSGETRWAVEPLALEPGPDSSEPAAARTLFLDRAHSAMPGCSFDAENAAAIEAICRRLDGLPLAIEMAAARIPVQSPVEIHHGLDDRFRLLRMDVHGTTDRQRTIHALLDWSYRLLGSDEQAALRRLSVFPAGFTVAAATAAITSGPLSDTRADPPALVWSLVEKSLLTADRSANDTRYRFLESVRVFAHGLLVDRGEAGHAARGAAAWLLERVGPWCRLDRTWVGIAATELDNLRGAGARDRRHLGRAGSAARLHDRALPRLGRIVP